MESIDSTVMDEKTYRAVLAMDFEWPYRDKMTYVVSISKMPENMNIKFIADDIVAIRHIF
jgi:hypothetical protein